MGIHNFKQIEPNQSEIDANLYKYFTSSFRKGYVEVTDKKYSLPLYWTEFQDQIENFEVKNSDIYVLTHPKTGTTWTQEMVWCISNYEEFEKAQKLNIQQDFIFKRFPFLEVTSLFDFRDQVQSGEIKRDDEMDVSDFFSDSVNYVRKLPGKRFIKSHLPFDLLPKQIRTGEKTPKMIYVDRNPKDTCVSYYHHCVNCEGYTGSFELFTQLFMKGKVAYGPYPEHIKSYYKEKKRDNILYLKFEDMKADLRSEIIKVAKFLNINTLDDKKIENLVNHLSFESMKNNISVNYEATDEFKGGKFMRSGTVGSYKAIMTPEIIAAFDKWIGENFNGTEVSF